MLVIRFLLIFAILIPPFFLEGWGPTLVAWALCYPVVSLLFNEGAPTTRARAAWLVPVLPIYLAFGLLPEVFYRTLVRIPLTGEDRPEYSWYGNITDPIEFFQYNHTLDQVAVKGLFFGLAVISIVLLALGHARAKKQASTQEAPRDAGWLSPGALTIAVIVLALGASLQWRSVEDYQTGPHGGPIETYERVSRGWPLAVSELDTSPDFGGRRVNAGGILGNMALAFGLGAGAGHVLRLLQRRRETAVKKATSI